MKIYTKTGDDGTTALYGGSRRIKSDERIEAYGSVDELQAALGVAMAELADGSQEKYLQPLQDIQHDAFVICSGLARISLKDQPTAEKIGEERIHWLEKAIDEMEQSLPPLTSFIMQGGGKAGAHLHVARTVCRRAERAVVRLKQKEQVDTVTLRYLNRLSDYLFVLARLVNHLDGQPETKWK